MVYTDLWPGIDLVCSGDQTRLKYECRVHPGADPRQIRLGYRGLKERLSLDRAGQLEIPTAVGTIRGEKPVSFQDWGRRVSISFVLMGEDGEKRQVYAGFIGGSGEDEAHGIAVDAAGRAVVTGVTTSTPTSFPELWGPALSLGGNSDVFVARIKADGSGLDYAGYIGGTGDEAGHSVAVDAAGNACVAGWTTSGASSFPVTGGPRLNYAGAIDRFVAKVDSTGSSLVYCGYIGGTDQDEALDIAVDSVGRAVVTGLTTSDQTTFQVATGPDLTFNGTVDAFVARVLANGSGLDFAGYLGGAGNDQGCGVAVDSSNRIYLPADPVIDSEGRFVDVPIELSARGGENGLTFSVQFDPESLLYAQALPGRSAGAQARLLVNDRSSTAGRLGLGLILTPGSGLAAGPGEVVVLRSRGPRREN